MSTHYNLRSRENSCEMTQPRFYLTISSSSSSCSSQSPSPTNSIEYDPIAQPLFSQQLSFESSSSDTSDDDFFSNNNTLIELEQTLTNLSPKDNWFNKQSDSYMVTTRSRSRNSNGNLLLDLFIEQRECPFDWTMQNKVI